MTNECISKWCFVLSLTESFLMHIWVKCLYFSVFCTVQMFVFIILHTLAAFVKNAMW